MKIKHINQFICPKDHSDLQLNDDAEIENDTVINGTLTCLSCKAQYTIKNRIIDFIGTGHYTGSFGYQWNKFAKTQLDSYSGIPISKERFFQVTQWQQQEDPNSIALEVGCGAGRFTEVAASTGIELFSLDASEAIYANQRNNQQFSNITFIRADLFNMPFRNLTFDKAYCLGVVQHTPSPHQAIEQIQNKVKKGGDFAIDVYSKTSSTWMWSKYWFRPILKKLPNETLFKFLEKVVPSLIFIHDLFRLIPGIGRFLAYRLVPVCNYKYTYPLSKEQNYQWALLDTFDMFSPTFDIPMSIDELNTCLSNLGINERDVKFGPNGIIATCKK